MDETDSSPQSSHMAATPQSVPLAVPKLSCASSSGYVSNPTTPQSAAPLCLPPLSATAITPPFAAPLCPPPFTTHASLPPFVAHVSQLPFAAISNPSPFATYSGPPPSAAWPSSQPTIPNVPLGLLINYEGMSWHPESASECSPEPAPFRELTESTPEPAPSRELTESMPECYQLAFSPVT